MPHFRSDLPPTHLHPCRLPCAVHQRSPGRRSFLEDRTVLPQNKVRLELGAQLMLISKYHTHKPPWPARPQVRTLLVHQDRPQAQAEGAISLFSCEKRELHLQARGASRALPRLAGRMASACAEQSPRSHARSSKAGTTEHSSC